MQYSVSDFFSKFSIDLDTKQLEFKVDDDEKATNLCESALKTLIGTGICGKKRKLNVTDYGGCAVSKGISPRRSSKQL